MEMTLWMRILAPRTGIALMLALAVAGSSFAAETDFEVLIDEDGVYRVDYEQLQMAGLDSPVASELLAVRSQGEETPIFVVDGGDGLFGPGDYFEMIGSRLVGETSWVHDYARHNVYRLSIDRAGGARMAARGEAAGEGAEASGLRVERHLEEDSMLVRLPGRNASQDSWFWKKLVHNQKAPIGIPLDLSGLDPEGRISVRLGVRGWSKPHNKASKEVADHRLVVRIGQRTILAESWNGSNPHELVLEDAPAAWFDLESPELLLRVPVRRETRDGDRALIDVVMLNWVEVSYSHLAEAPARDERLLVDGGEALNLGALAAPVRIYTSSGGRAELQGSGVMPLEPADHAVRVSRQALLKTPVAVLPDSRSSWLEPAQQADYLIVTHQAFKQAIEPLANLHRKRGLKVSVAEVGDLYDEFNHGIAHPRAIRDFVAYASSTWQKPAPRFLLLVGDASWDLKNSEADDSLYADWTYRRGESLNFAKNDSTTYEGGTGRLRHFVPTWQAMTHQGHAASDNYFADIDGENGEPDGMPDLAVGRLPVASVEEVEAILAKIKAYIEEPQAGDWQRKVLLVTNEQSIFQKRSDQLADKLSGEGFL
ncbi:MAG: C25 family cysteine peptidase, partial [Acidobacteriota bacterium]